MRIICCCFVVICLMFVSGAETHAQDAPEIYNSMKSNNTRLKVNKSGGQAKARENARAQASTNRFSSSNTARSSTRRAARVTPSRNNASASSSKPRVTSAYVRKKSSAPSTPSRVFTGY